MCWFFALLAVLVIVLIIILICSFHFYLVVALVAAFIIILLILHCYRKHLIKRVCCIPFCEKIQKLNDISEPFGFMYHYPDDIFSSTQDAWQRPFGYCRLYDDTAPLFGIILESEPVYFDYQGKTWLIEFWKGQYGINTGAEVGIYHANGIIPKSRRHKVVFDSVDDAETLKINYRLLSHKKQIFSVCAKHWWLTGFSMGMFSEPKDLQLAVCLTFPELAMRNAFLESLLDLGYDICDVNTYHLSISFCFAAPKSRQPSFVRPGKIARVQICNRIVCRLFLLITRPFDNTLDRLTYLRLALPFIFRRTVCMKKVSKRYKKSWRIH